MKIRKQIICYPFHLIKDVFIDELCRRSLYFLASMVFMIEAPSSTKVSMFSLGSCSPETRFLFIE